MQQQVVMCPNCAQGAAPGQPLCMNCGSTLPIPNPAPSPLQPFDYRCPNCGTPHPPQIVRRLSSIGVFLLIFGFLFFLVGALLAPLFMQERRVCPICGSTVAWVWPKSK